jgi:hypothetical protein
MFGGHLTSRVPTAADNAGTNWRELHNMGRKYIKVSHAWLFALLSMAVTITFLQTGSNAQAASGLLADSVADWSVPAESAPEQYARQYGVDLETAKHRLKLQADGAALPTALAAQLDASYAGVWFDNNLGEFVVPSVSGSAASIAREVLREVGVDEDARLPLVDDSWGALERTKAALSARVSRSDTPEGALVMSDPVHNLVTLSIPRGEGGPSLVQAEQLADMQSADAEVVAVARGATTIVDQAECHFGFKACQKPFRAGLDMQTLPSGTPTHCTSAFNARNGVGDRFVLTAGHCIHAAENWYSQKWEPANNTTEMKGLGFPDMVGPGDWARLKVNGFWWDNASSWPVNMVVWGTDFKYPIEAEAASYVGQYVCHMGRTTGGPRCGTVTGLGAENTQEPGQTNLTLFGPTCSESGDSGGPVYGAGGHVALGIFKGAFFKNPIELPPCGEQTGVYSEITDATDALGVTVGPRLGSPPQARGESVGEVRPTEATVLGTVAPHGITANYHCQYGTTTAYGQATALAAAGSGWGFTPVSCNLSNLLPGTTYHVRMVAQNSSGTHVDNDDLTFTTKQYPEVLSQAVADISSTKATLKASIRPNGLPTNYWFEYGTTAAFGNETAFLSAGSGLSPVNVTESLTGLVPVTKYYFRAVAINDQGSYRVGPTEMFTTPPAGWTYLSRFGGAGSGPGQFKNAIAGAAADASGNVYVVDQGNHRIQRFNEAGEFLSQFGIKGTGPGELSAPLSIAVDAEGDVWVGQEGKIQEFSSAGVFIRQIGPSEAAANKPVRPTSLAIGGNGRVYAVDYSSETVVEYSPTPNGEGKYFLNRYAKYGGSWLGPLAIATAPNGAVDFIGGFGSFIYQVIPSGGIGKVCSIPATTPVVSKPKGLEIDPQGNFLVPTVNNAVFQFSSTCNLQGTFGEKGSGPGQFREPGPVALTKNGVLFVGNALGTYPEVTRWAAN